MDVQRFLDEVVRASSRNRHFYHFTDSRNVPSIRATGIHSTRALSDLGVTVIARGGNDWSQEADLLCGMDAFVHLCFDQSHPMEYAARQDGRIQSSVFLKIKPEILLQPGVLVTAEVSNKSGVVPYQPSAILGTLDLEVLYARTDWRDAEVRKRLLVARKYEILVPNHVAPEFIVDG